MELLLLVKAVEILAADHKLSLLEESNVKFKGTSMVGNG